jgi:hypothetical protein
MPDMCTSKAWWAEIVSWMPSRSEVLDERKPWRLVKLRRVLSELLCGGNWWPCQREVVMSALSRGWTGPMGCCRLRCLGCTTEDLWPAASEFWVELLRDEGSKLEAMKARREALVGI